MTRHAAAVGVVIAFSVASAAAHAHELRPAYLDLHELSEGEFAVLWKTPMRSEARLALTPEFAAGALARSDVTTRVRSGAAIQEWILHAPRLRGSVLRISGIEGTMTDVFVRITFADGTTWTHLLTPRKPAATIIPKSARPENQATQETPGASELPALAAWALVCGASAVVRRRPRGRGAIAVACAAYIVGIAAAFWVIRAVVETIGLT